MSVNRASLVPLGLVALPGTAAAALALTAFALGLAGLHPLWRAEPLNMSEAAAYRDGATVLELIRAGEDPDARRPVHQGAVFSRDLMLTPLEAAVAAGRAEVVEVWLSAHPTLDPRAWIEARCVARFGRTDDIKEAVDRHRPVDVPADFDADRQCENVRRRW
jgi:hypothetical protein